MEKDASPPAGQWDYKGSRIWINGKVINPPVWSTPGQHSADLETPYTNEPYENRPPLVVALRKGWNKVLLKLPAGAFQTADIVWSNGCLPASLSVRQVRTTTSQVSWYSHPINTFHLTASKV
ncbi:hypothetical protein [Spirosoma aerolatum]|uniref:hypothetical protein n=1 Tax=Spirosoma aerolatum TaxID=1211326 RepID=UPI001FE3EC46|nr:hypothetical protein [Spirosoma aerolatum]